MPDKGLGPWSEEAADHFQRISQDWGSGELTQSSDGRQTDIPCIEHIQFVFRPLIEGAGLTEKRCVVHFDLFIGVDADTAFETRKQALLDLNPDDFIDWPPRFPDAGNDYEFVSHCGANAAKTEVFFTQGQTTWTLVVVKTSSDTESLVQYADGAWQVVYALGLCQ